MLGLSAKEKGPAAGVRSGPERRANAADGSAVPGSRLARSATAKTRRARIEQRQLIERLLAELDEKDAAMLVMKEVEGFSVEEIGEMLWNEREHREGPVVSGAREAGGGLSKAICKMRRAKSSEGRRNGLKQTETD